VLSNLGETAVILAGGLGTRLRSVVSDRPKPMADVNGRPFLDYLVNRLFSNGFTKIVICVSYMRENIISYFEKKYGDAIIFSIEDTPLGTGGALAYASEKLPESFLVMNGDTYLPMDYQKLRSYHIEKKADLTIALAKSSSPQFGGVAINSAERVLAFGDIRSGLVNAGVYEMERKVIDMFPTIVPFSLEKQFLPEFVETGKVYGFVSDDSFVDIGSPESYLSLVKNADILKK
jgi:D-glycero-alpha-D-manno-heptose 1-phosphate guanylyltransferase